MSYRNSDGSITLEKVCMTAATYQHIHDSVMVDYGAGDIIKETILVDNPIKRDELYRKLVFEAYAEYVEPLDKWVYRGSEENAQDLIWISDSRISKSAFEEMESVVRSYTDDSLLTFEEEKEENRESAYIDTIVEDYVREMVMGADMAMSAHMALEGYDDIQEAIFERYFS